VCFESSVKIHPIPSRSDYSERVRSSLWQHPAEFQANLRRNMFEIQAENWDWRQATEEKDMVLMRDELVHPVHFMRQCNMKRQFLLIMSAQLRV
jgi:hypothetical protein